MAGLREEFERRYGPLWSGASSLSIEGVSHELHDVMHRIGFGFEGIKIIDAPRVEAGRYAIRFSSSVRTSSSWRSIASTSLNGWGTPTSRRNSR